ncbi:hypothetical protein PC111_g9417 [Phytophthora cactorum]|nr:hypothetical protein PC111_g9417 [Phytophthora cactorum]KAG3010171.1 hypothetical protein PC120_g15197 [Phytophthora cactorum]KAG3164550.1 hypothetical protein C6341_g12634 [Phytophthora cactorum]KAG3198637.1 hypothetical protein PC128_g5895 [Phytophthora cactorum]
MKAMSHSTATSVWSLSVPYIWMRADRPTQRVEQHCDVDESPAEPPMRPESGVSNLLHSLQQLARLEPARHDVVSCIHGRELVLLALKLRHSVQQTTIAGACT